MTVAALGAAAATAAVALALFFTLPPMKTSLTNTNGGWRLEIRREPAPPPPAGTEEPHLDLDPPAGGAALPVVPLPTTPQETGGACGIRFERGQIDRGSIVIGGAPVPTGAGRFWAVQISNWSLVAILATAAASCAALWLLLRNAASR